MEAQDRDKLSQKIAAEILRVEGDIINLKEQTKPISPDNAIGRLSRMEAINSKSIQEANLRNATERLANLKIAQQKLGDEDFGLCKECDEPIPMARLMAMPEKAICVECANRRGS